MKIKKIQLIRPECDVELKRPFIGRICLAFCFPRLIVIKRGSFKTEIKSHILENAAHVSIHRVLFIAIPKIKVVKSE